MRMVLILPTESQCNNIDRNSGNEICHICNHYNDQGMVLSNIYIYSSVEL